ncbi:MAG: hypothetical protein JWO89_149 [Verrucomicrobiaceae bacterium]|nr:hypothetical protein [Verrucomicrobiaceae bacterium]
MAMGLAAVLALLVMKASLLALSNNQWTVFQTLTDAYLTRETALSNRLPLADLTGASSQWPDSAMDSPPRLEQNISLGKLAGGKAVDAVLTRFRVNETPNMDPDTGLAVWRLHSVLSYTVGGHRYFKTRSTLRMQ